MNAARAGRWSPNEDDSGLVLMGLYRNDGYKPMLRADGSRIEVKFGLPSGALAPSSQPDPRTFGGSVAVIGGN
jgi:hypothetical protein